MEKYCAQYFIGQVILAVIGIIYQNKNKPAKTEEDPSLGTPLDVFVVDMNNTSTPVNNKNELNTEFTKDGNHPDEPQKSN